MARIHHCKTATEIIETLIMRIFSTVVVNLNRAEKENKACSCPYYKQ